MRDRAAISTSGRIAPDTSAWEKCGFETRRWATGPAPSAFVVLIAIWCWKTAPSPATPVAIPTWRKVLLIPEAMPLREWCTTPTAVDASGGLIMPMPAPASTKPGISVVHPEFASIAVMLRRPPLTSRRPEPISSLIGTETESLPEIGATTNDTKVIGRKRRPACSGS